MFWDSSAVVPVLIAESRSSEMVALLRSDEAPAVWWGSPVECQSAFYRRRREEILSSGALGAALARLERFAEDVDVVAPTARASMTVVSVSESWLASWFIEVDD